MAKNIPNIITILRILFAAMLLIIPYNRALFLSMYALCVLTDILDGYITRRYGLTSKAGAKLDSLADGAVAAAIGILLFKKNLLLPYARLIIMVVCIRLINLIATRLRFKQWGMLHTFSNKATGLAVFLAVPYYYCRGSLPYIVEVILWTLAIASSIEETLIILSNNTYNNDEKEIVWRIIQK